MRTVSKTFFTLVFTYSRTQRWQDHQKNIEKTDFRDYFSDLHDHLNELQDHFSNLQFIKMNFKYKSVTMNSPIFKITLVILSVSEYTSIKIHIERIYITEERDTIK